MPGQPQIFLRQGPAAVTLGLAQESGWAVISVADTGRGIAPGDLPQVFRRGFTTRPGDGGLGLGLAIVKESAQVMGGRVRVESAPGAGSRFEVLFPLLQSPGSP